MLSGQQIGCMIVGPTQTGVDARRHDRPRLVEEDPHPEHRAEPVGQRGEIGVVDDVVADHEELVLTEATDRVVGTHCRAETARDQGQHVEGRTCTRREVVGHLNIDEQNPHAPSCASSAGEGDLQPISNERRPRQPRRGIEELLVVLVLLLVALAQYPHAASHDRC